MHCNLSNLLSKRSIPAHLKSTASVCAAKLTGRTPFSEFCQQDNAYKNTNTGINSKLHQEAQNLDLLKKKKKTNPKPTTPEACAEKNQTISQLCEEEEIVMKIHVLLGSLFDTKIWD